MKKNQSVIIAIILLCALGALFAIMYLNEDREGPVLTVDTSKVKPYSQSQGTDILKSYVKAVDKKDGDVSGSVLVEQIYVSSDLTKANIIYAARDKHNNITKKTFTIDYIASEQEIARRDKAEGKEQETTSAEEQTSETKNVNAKEKTSVADTTIATTEAETVEGGPKLVLTSTEDTIAVGSKFNIMQYIEEISDDKDSSDVLARRIITNGTVNTSKKGTYKVDVYCTDTDRNRSNQVTLTIHVE